MVKRRIFLAGLTFALAGVAAASAGWAHHGWRWAEDSNHQLTGIIKSAKLGNPHGLLQIEADGEIWTVEVGQPWRNERAGLTDDMLGVGTEIAVDGHRSADPDEKVLKAERVTIGGKLYDLYPDRD
jgi:hypothetical protein